MTQFSKTFFLILLCLAFTAFAVAQTQPVIEYRVLATTNARPMQMKGRAVSGWLHVDGDNLRTEQQLAQWIAIGAATAQNAPAKRL